MKKFLKLMICGFIGIGALASCGDNTASSNQTGESGSSTTTTSTPSPTETTPSESSVQPLELKFKTAVLTSTENEGELKVRAEVNGSVGKIYYILVEGESTTPTGEQIVAGVNYDSVVVSKKGDSGSTQAIDTLITDLEKGVEYTAYFVINQGSNYSDVQTKKATTYKEPINMGAGTLEDPFKIYTAQDLAAVGCGVYETYGLDFAKDAYYTLMNDIDLSTVCGEEIGSWTPINIDSPAIFDGQGYKISGVYINTTTATTPQGLFGQINKAATVKNLVLDGVSITSNSYIEEIKNGDIKVQLSGGTYVGALSGDLKGSVENVKVRNAVVNASGTRVGGIAGRAYADVDTAVSIKNTSVEATITGVGRLGGIVGLVDCKDAVEFTKTNFENLTFKGTITGTKSTTTIDGVDYDTPAQYIGGAFGYFRAADAKNIVVDATINGQQHCGGIVGFMQRRSATSKYTTNLSGAIFNGSVTVTSGSNCAAIVGNKSTGYSGADFTFAEGFYTATSTFTFVGDTVNKTAVTGVGVELDALTATWYQENMSTMDFTDIFQLDETTKLPTLK